MAFEIQNTLLHEINGNSELVFKLPAFENDVDEINGVLISAKFGIKIKIRTYVNITFC